MFLRREAERISMSNKIGTDIKKIYILALKYNIKLRDIPSTWLNIDRTARSLNTDHYSDRMPEYVKLIIKYSTEFGRIKNGTRA